MRLGPRSVTGQFALLLTLALLIANAIAVVILSAERDRLVQEARREAQVDRLATLAAVLARLPPADREATALALSTRTLALAVEPAPSLERAARGPSSAALAALIERRLGDAGLAADVRVALGRRFGSDRRNPAAESLEGERWDGWRRWHEGSQWRRQRHRSHGQALIASIAMPGGGWLNARAVRPRRLEPLVGRAVLVTLGLSLAAVLGVGLWFIRRMTRPIRALASAAERAGYGDRSARVTVAGPGEVRRASEAFNAMQERIARFDAERARTVAAVGHDLRTPITALRIRAELVDDAEGREAMVRTLDEMRVMADGLLAYGRSEAENEPRGELDLSQTLRELAARRGTMMRYSGPDRLPIEGRPVALSRAFANLIENAERYGGGGTITLATEPGWAVLTIADAGPGIAPERLEEVLEPFVRLDASRSVETGGAGLGLSIARTLIRAHGGTLTLANRAEGGLSATVKLPLPR